MTPDAGIIAVSYPTISVACADCGNGLSPIDRATRRGGKWICLACADLDHLVYLPAGETALTRRAMKHSTLSAVVYQFSKSRKRNERQGTLVEEAGLASAEAECVGDEEARARARDRAAVRRNKLEAAYIRDFAEHIATIYPGCPADIRDQIAGHACEKYSDRIGRSAASKEFSPEAIRLAVRAHVRHNYTRYDGLLMQGIERDLARQEIEDECGAVLGAWEKPDEFYPPPQQD